MKNNNVNAAEYAQQMSISSNMASALVESFGYEPQLDELSMQDLGDFGRGALSGATFGFNKNIAAGANSLFKGTKYKDELQKQVQADREAEMRSPKAFKAGDIAGAVAVPIPGATALKGAMAAKNLGKAATIGGLAAHQGVGAMTGKAASDALSAHTLGDTDKIMKLQQEIGATPDGKFGPKTRAKLKAWQQQQGIPVTGVLDTETLALAGISESLVDISYRLKAKIINEGIGDAVLKWGAKAAKDAIGKGGFGKAKPFIRNVPSNASVPATSSKAGEFIPKSNLPATAAQAAEKDAIDSTATGFDVAKSTKSGEFIPKSKVPASAAQAAEKDAIDSTVVGANKELTPASASGEYIPGMKVGGKTANVDKNIADGSFREIEQKALGDNRLSSADKAAINKTGIKDWIAKNPKKAGMLGYLGLLAASNLGDVDAPTGGMPGKATAAMPATPEPGMPGKADDVSPTTAAPTTPGASKDMPTAPPPSKGGNVGGTTGSAPVNPKAATPRGNAKPSAPAKPSGNPRIMQWQRLLNANGANLKVDGKYSPEMQAAYDKIFPSYQRESKELDRIVQLSRR